MTTAAEARKLCLMTPILFCFLRVVLPFFAFRRGSIPGCKDILFRCADFLRNIHHKREQILSLFSVLLPIDAWMEKWGVFIIGAVQQSLHLVNAERTELPQQNGDILPVLIYGESMRILRPFHLLTPFSQVYRRGVLT